MKMGKRAEKRDAIRDMILTTASKRMRELGFNGIGVDGLAEDAGFTSGVVYSQFGSKEDLLVEVLRRGFELLRVDTEERISRHGDEWYRKRHDQYLSLRHRDMIGEGCLLPNLSVDSARGGENVQKVYEDGLKALVDAFSDGLPPSQDPTPQERAYAAIALMAGGILLSRAVGSSQMASEILQGCRKFLP